MGRPPQRQSQDLAALVHTAQVHPELIIGQFN